MMLASMLPPISIVPMLPVATSEPLRPPAAKTLSMSAFQSNGPGSYARTYPVTAVTPSEPLSAPSRPIAPSE